jgi:hypothetical protein
MDLFRCRVIPSISGHFGTAFWAHLVVPAMMTEPAITHAVVALTSAHKSSFYGPRGWSADQERVTLSQYTKAIRHLQPLLASCDNTSTTIVLIVCLLFTSLEYLRGRHQAAALHLHNGLKVLRNLYEDCADPSHGVLIVKHTRFKRAINSVVFQSFAGLHVQAGLFGNHVPDVALVLQVTETETPYSIFVSEEEARDSLEKLLHGIVLIAGRMRIAIAETGECPRPLIEGQGLALAHLATWRTTYEQTTSERKLDPAQKHLAYTLLLNYHTMATIMCKSMDTRSEGVYEEHIDDFISIIQRSIELWKHYSNPQNEFSNILVVDMGWIPPLYYTALKCRISQIRLHAIRLLKSVPHKEGVWDSNLATIIANRVKQLEEQHLHINTSSGDDFGLGEIPCLSQRERAISLPESGLFYEVQVTPIGTNGVLLTCKRWYNNIDSIVRCEYDGDQWHDLQP